jgi:hypothetical protein
LGAVFMQRTAHRVMSIMGLPRYQD